MKLGTLRQDGGGSVAVRIDQEEVVRIGDFADLGDLLQAPDWMARATTADGPRFRVDTIDPAAWAPVVPQPGKIICVGLNYATHIAEMDRPLPEHPTLFAKFADALIGANDDIRVASEHAFALDWEGELALVIGTRCFRPDGQAAADAIAGYAVINDVTMRDHQYRTSQWLQGKTLQDSAPFGPYLVTVDEVDPAPVLTTSVNGAVQQRAEVSDLVFGPEALVNYIAQFVTLHPGDVIASGTPGGVGHAQHPPRCLVDGDVLETSVSGLGQQRNRIVIATGDG